MNLRVPKREDFPYLDVGLRLVRYLHEELGSTLDHVLENGLVHTVRRGQSQYERNPVIITDTAPRLSELDTKRYSLPSAMS